MLKQIMFATFSLLISVGIFISCTPEAYYTSDQINYDRAANGLAPLEFNAMLHMKAQAHAEQLRNQGYLSHTRLVDNNWSTTWARLGENVGYSWNDLSLMQGYFMASAPHRANILGPYNKVGTGVVSEETIYGIRYWVVQEFMWESCC